MISREYNYSFGDDTDIITEQTTESYPMCEELKNVIDSFIKNKVLPYTDDLSDAESSRLEYIIECADHERRINLHTALHFYGKPQKSIEGKDFAVDLDGTLSPIKGKK